jgi:hypothetical protein
LEEYRRSQPGRAKLPESIWEAAAALAREHGVYAIAQALRLDYMGLRKRYRGPGFFGHKVGLLTEIQGD